MYTPDNWIIIKITPPCDELNRKAEPLYKILAGWSGGYLDGDAWRMNSGITKVEENEDYIDFIGESGSIYRCHKDQETLRMNCAYIWEQLKKEYPDVVDRIGYDDFVKEFKAS